MPPGPWREQGDTSLAGGDNARPLAGVHCDGERAAEARNVQALDGVAGFDVDHPESARVRRQQLSGAISVEVLRRNLEWCCGFLRRRELCGLPAAVLEMPAPNPAVRSQPVELRSTVDVSVDSRQSDQRGLP